ncbi:MAG: hypothetical protein IKI76_06320 [Selenomonadaceae bacterium]|nr:hypothetical protein [Selenomonadaceae bacterium]
MKINVIMDIVYLVIFSLCVLIGESVVKSWWSFFFGAVVALSVRDLGSELSQRLERRQARRVR